MENKIHTIVCIAFLPVMSLFAGINDYDNSYPYPLRYVLTHRDFASPIEIATNMANSGTNYYFQIKLVITKGSAIRNFMQQHPNQGFHFEVGTNLTCNVDPGWQKDTNSILPITLTYPSFEKAKAAAE